MKLKKILALGAVAALALGLGACGGASDSEIAKNSDNKMQVFQFDELKNGQTEVNFPANTPVKIQLSQEMLDALPEGFVEDKASIKSMVMQSRTISPINCVFETEVQYVDEAKDGIIQRLSQFINNNSNQSKIGEIPSDDDLILNTSYVTNDFSKMAFAFDCSKEEKPSSLEQGYWDGTRERLKGLAGVSLESSVQPGGSIKIKAEPDDGLTLSATGKWQFDPKSVES